jgi:hypothetical protein
VRKKGGKSIRQWDHITPAFPRDILRRGGGKPVKTKPYQVKKGKERKANHYATETIIRDRERKPNPCRCAMQTNNIL